MRHSQPKMRREADARERKAAKRREREQRRAQKRVAAITATQGTKGPGQQGEVRP